MDSTSPIPGISGGILRPKLSHHFVVRFLVQADATEDEAKKIASHLNALSMQTVSLQLPTRSFEGVLPEAGEGKLKNVKMEGPLTITIEDDITSAAVEALEYLGSNPALTIVVLKMDGNDQVCNAYRFSRAHISSYEHTLLDYGDGGEGCAYTVKFNFKAAQFGSFPTPVEMKDLL